MRERSRSRDEDIRTQPVRERSRSRDEDIRTQPVRERSRSRDDTQPSENDTRQETTQQEARTTQATPTNELPPNNVHDNRSTSETQTMQSDRDATTTETMESDVPPTASLQTDETEISEPSHESTSLDVESFYQQIRDSVEGLQPRSGLPWTLSESSTVHKGPWRHNGCFASHVLTGNTEFYAYLDNHGTYVSSDSILSEDELRTHEDMVKEADLNEIRSFVTHKVWTPILWEEVDYDVKVMKCVWIRKWKTLMNGTRIIKSRLCVKGFMDSQLPYLSTHASTATRISQKFILSLAVNKKWQVRLADISTAFLQGFGYAEMAKVYNDLKIPTPKLHRKGCIDPPGNVWFHLQKLGMWGTSWSHVLRLLKPMYGLADAPQSWQYALRWTLVQMGAVMSVMDECFYYWKNNKGNLIAAMTTHVDDCSITGEAETIQWIVKELTTRFGKMAESPLPMTHVGIRYEQTASGGIRLTQKHFLRSIKEIPLDKARSKSPTSPCNPQEITQLRGLIGSLLYLTITRLDLISDLCTLQSTVNNATVEQLIQANKTLKRAIKDEDRGITFEPLVPPYRLQVITDASFATRRTSYALQGVILCLMEDRPGVEANLTYGFAHVLHASGSRAKRVSHSTSHAESLAAYAGISLAESVAMRFTEMQAPIGRNTLKEYLALEEKGVYDVSIDAVTDCHDLTDLLLGHKGVPQDRSQRLVILSLRERISSKTIRHLQHIATDKNPANGLTKYDAKDIALINLMDESGLWLT
eukprot:6490899-Amphidinium_carterae.1